MRHKQCCKVTSLIIDCGITILYFYKFMPFTLLILCVFSDFCISIYGGGDNIIPKWLLVFSVSQFLLERMKFSFGCLKPFKNCIYIALYIE